jgi:hypothetical protein
MPLKLKILLNIIWLLLGKKCKYKNQPYTIIYKNGYFQTEKTGTKVSNFKDMIKLK